MSVLVPPAQLSLFDEHLTEKIPNDPNGYNQHVFLNKDDDGHPYLKIRILSAAPPNSLPSYIGNTSPITGSVELDLKKPTGISSVTVTLKGLIVNSEIDTRPFLELEEKLISEKTELEGIQNWPFSFSLPDSVVFDDKKADSLGLDIKPDTAYSLPPTLSSTTFGTMIDYVVSVKVKHSSFFGTDLSISTLIGYTPTNLSYDILVQKEGISGWADFEAKLEGAVFDHRKVDVICKLSVASPVVFKRGSVIPVRLTITSSDTQVLDLLAQPDVPVAELTARSKTSPGVASFGSALAWRKLQEIPRVIWKKEVGEDEGPSRILEGELSIPVGIEPSFTFGALAVFYTLDIIPLKTTGFKPSPGDFLFNVPVSVAIH